VVIALIAIIVGYYMLRPRPAERVVKFSILPPEGTTFVNVAQAGPPALSPDGRMIVFAAQKAGQDRLLWIRPLDSLEARPLPGTEGAVVPFWSPDGSSLGFGAQGQLKKIDLVGGAVQVLASSRSVPAGQPVPNGAWSADGRILFAPAINANTGLFTMSAQGGDESPAPGKGRGKPALAGFSSGWSPLSVSPAPGKRSQSGVRRVAGIEGAHITADRRRQRPLRSTARRISRLSAVR
jgi:hypothetical protein